MAQQQQQMPMQMPPAQVKAGGPGSYGNQIQNKNDTVARDVSQMGVLGEIQKSLADPTKRAALERFLATLDQQGQ